MTFLYGAEFLSIPVEPAIALSLIFFMLHALNSLMGLVFEWQFPELDQWKEHTPKSE